MKHMLEHVRRWAPVLALSASLLGSAVHSAPLYSQAANTAGAAYLSTDSVQNADSFQLGYAASLQSVSFYGSDVNLSTLTVRLFAGDVALIPDTYTTLTGTIARSALQFQVTSGGVMVDIYEFTLALDSAYVTTANQQYYVSVFSTVNWGWLEGAVGDNQSAFRGADGSTWDKDVPDLAFAIGGDRLVVNQAPEPASLVLVGMALLAAVHARRRVA